MVINETALRSEVTNTLIQKMQEENNLTEDYAGQLNRWPRTTRYVVGTALQYTGLVTGITCALAEARVFSDHVWIETTLRMGTLSACLVGYIYGEWLKGATKSPRRGDLESTCS